MRIAAIAPSFKLEKSLWQSLIRQETLNNWDLEVPPELHGKSLLYAHSDEARFQYLLEAYKSGYEVIWSVRGGAGCLQFFPELLKNKEVIKKSKSLLVGFSDITILHWFLNVHLKRPSLHGLLLNQMFDESCSGKSQSLTLKMIEDFYNNEIDQTYMVKPLNESASKSKKMTGTLLGGNLTCLASLVGIAKPAPKKSILFLEDVGERAYRLDRSLHQLFQSGFLNNIEAVVLGEFGKALEPKTQQNLVPAFIKSWSENQKIPVWTGLKSGHGRINYPLLFGAQVSIKRIPSETSRIKGELSWEQ